MVQKRWLTELGLLSSKRDRILKCSYPLLLEIDEKLFWTKDYRVSPDLKNVNLPDATLEIVRGFNIAPILHKTVLYSTYTAL
ncbi:hypothetical protein CEXT_452201 [Caerostris extrusa]|uniref:Uncharacterized protein n=1 Tax=Caerostris extrusa TaxID=172846 RepID=A0AAV4MBN7_CAEEX|nr:hypothetical protein CEXT_452201 [Caerostris extrusa]